MEKHEQGCVLGRFQFFHKGHEQLIVEAAKLCEKLTVFIGSSQEFGTVKNPLTYEQRRDVIQLCFTESGIDNARICEAPDILHDDEFWEECLAENYTFATHSAPIPMYCFDRGNDIKDRPFINDYFEVYKLENANDDTISSTELREVYYLNKVYPQRLLNLSACIYTLDLYYKYMPEYSLMYIDSLDLSDSVKEFSAFVDEKLEWSDAEEAAPFPLPAFDCVDVIVIDPPEQKVLSIIRSQYPGKGKRALPGGFVDKGESWEKSAARELEEETGLTCSTSDLEFGAAISAGERGGNRNTFVFYVDIRNCSGKLVPQVGEVEKIEWVDLPAIGERGWFSDHAHIINRVIGVY